MNVYDFDETIYDGDCTVDFLLYLYKKKTSLPCLFNSGTAFLKYKLFHTITKEKMKEEFFKIITKFDDIPELIEKFWDEKEKGIKEFYLKQRKDDDLVISASPEFLIKPICNRLGIASMASRVDYKTGKFDGLNCHGAEKVKRFKEVYDKEIDEFYSDSYSDTPLAKIAKKAYLVKGNKIIKWEGI